MLHPQFRGDNRVGQEQVGEFERYSTATADSSARVAPAYIVGTGQSDPPIGDAPGKQTERDPGGVGECWYVHQGVRARRPRADHSERGLVVGQGGGHPAVGRGQSQGGGVAGGRRASDADGTLRVDGLRTEG